MRSIFFVALLIVSHSVSSQLESVESDVVKFGTIYTLIITNQLNVRGKYNGQNCKINLRLMDAGLNMQVKGVNIIDGFPSPHNTLCREALKVIASLEGLPKSDSAEVNSLLTNLNLTIVPE
ncbi:cell envelope integrity TolA C-terminal domain-containing protein [Vibrio mediterranei]|uniref:cell envelope integrity TolA C-terminal domain-containing protein n=1 Tax=Vibrio mediterranei TaxID=689 RepID=UPI00148D5752|nr:cell envelope integrity TolA C-terminal domain-containing protein [Vibrio mediterranei]NOH31657.1 hypothetical protein [Vibrio mediterranei]